jgi:predicted nucleotide-binding protein
MSENNPGADTWQTVRDFVAADPELQRYMQLSFDAFHQTGDWPDVEKLQRQLLREDGSLDLYAVGDRIPSEIGTNPVRADNHCQLTVAGVALCKGSDEEVHGFMTVLRIAAHTYLAEDPGKDTSMSLNSEELRDAMHLTDVALRRIFRMIEWEPFIAGGDGSIDSTWRRNIGNLTRHFVRANTFDEYMRMKGSLTSARRPPVMIARDFAGLQSHVAVQTRPAPVERVIERQSKTPDLHSVFVVHGRNNTARDGMFAFLRALGLQPIEWSQAVAMTGHGSPYIGTVLDTAFDAAQAVVVLFTPDEVAYLRPEYSDRADDPDTRPLAQSRPNVLFEAGMAIGRDAKRTVLVELGTLRAFSDVMGRHAVRLDGSPKTRAELAQRLETAGCAVDRSGTDWLTAGNLTPPPDIPNLNAQRSLPEAPRVRTTGSAESIPIDLPSPNPKLKGTVRPTYEQGYLTGILLEALDERGQPARATYRYVMTTNGNSSPPQESCCTPLSIGMGGIARGTTWSVSGWVSLKGEVAPLSGSGVAP